MSDDAPGADARRRPPEPDRRFGAGHGGWPGSTRAAAGVLLPWIVYLAITLPEAATSTATTERPGSGFDVLLVFAIVRTAYMAFRIDPRVQFPATATATLLFVDAWFDVTTSGSRGQVLEALVLAAC